MKAACILLLSIALIGCDKSSTEPAAEKKSAVQIAKEPRAARSADADKTEDPVPVPDSVSFARLVIQCRALHKEWMIAERDFRAWSLTAPRDKDGKIDNAEYEAASLKASTVYEKYSENNRQLMSLEQKKSTAHRWMFHHDAFRNLDGTATKLRSKLKDVAKQDGVDSPAFKELQLAWDKMINATLDDVIRGNYWKPVSLPPTPALTALAESALLQRRDWITATRGQTTWIFEEEKKAREEKRTPNFDEIEAALDDMQKMRERCQPGEKEIGELEYEQNGFSGGKPYTEAFGKLVYAANDLANEWKAEATINGSDTPAARELQAAWEKMATVSLDDVMKGNYWKLAPKELSPDASIPDLTADCLSRQKKGMIASRKSLTRFIKAARASVGILEIREHPSIFQAERDRLAQDRLELDFRTEKLSQMEFEASGLAPADRFVPRFNRFRAAVVDLYQACWDEETVDGSDSPAARKLRAAWDKMEAATLEDVMKGNYWKPAPKQEAKTPDSDAPTADDAPLQRKEKETFAALKAALVLRRKAGYSEKDIQLFIDQPEAATARYEAARARRVEGDALYDKCREELLDATLLADPPQPQMAERIRELMRFHSAGVTISNNLDTAEQTQGASNPDIPGLLKDWDKLLKTRLEDLSRKDYPGRSERTW